MGRCIRFWIACCRLLDESLCSCRLHASCGGSGFSIGGWWFSIDGCAVLCCVVV